MWIKLRSWRTRTSQLQHAKNNKGKTIITHKQHLSIAGGQNSEYGCLEMAQKYWPLGNRKHSFQVDP